MNKIKRKIVFKDHYVATRKGSEVIKLAKKLVCELRHLSKKIKIVGSIRRKDKFPVDIDLVLIPKNKEKLKSFLQTRGRFIEGGEQRFAFRIEGVKAEFYFASEEDWGAQVLAWTGPQGSAIGLRLLAKKKGWLLNQHGLFDKKTGRRIAGRTEREIFKKLNHPWKKPEERGD